MQHLADIAPAGSHHLGIIKRDSGSEVGTTHHPHLTCARRAMATAGWLYPDLFGLSGDGALGDPHGRGRT